MHGCGIDSPTYLAPKLRMSGPLSLLPYVLARHDTVRPLPLHVPLIRFYIDGFIAFTVHAQIHVFKCLVLGMSCHLALLSL